MKVLIVHEVFMPDFCGGGEKIMYELAKNLAKKGVQVKVLTTGKPEIKEYEGIKTIRLPINRYLMNLAFFSILKEAKDCDLIHCSSYNAFFPAWLAGKISRKPVICYAMGLYGKRWLKMRGWLGGIISRIGEKIQLKRSYDRMVFLSDYSKELGKEIGIEGEKIRVVNPGVEAKEFKEAKKKEFVLFAGRFAKQKGVDSVIEAAKRLPKIKFVMIGWGEEEERLKRVAPANITFYNGKNNRKKLLELYSEALVCFFPSVGETFGLVITEAMASGCAIVSTIPLDYEGFRVEPGAGEEMAERIKYLIDNKEMALEMGRKNAEKAKNYSWEKSAEEFLEIYREVMKKQE